MIFDKLDALLGLFFGSEKNSFKLEAQKIENHKPETPAFQGDMGEAAFYQDLPLEKDEVDLDDPEYIADLTYVDDSEYMDELDHMDDLEPMDDFMFDREDEDRFF